MPQTFKLKLAYNGTSYSGFQTQKDLPTIQSVLNAAVQKITGEKVTVKPSGRTDTGVHAFEQVCNFTLNTAKGIKRALSLRFVYCLNCVLPDDILVLICVPKSGFDAQKNAQSKVYEYVILISPHANPFLEKLVWRLPKKLNVTAMKKAAKHLTGKHDFSSFCAADSTAKTRVREILQITFRSKSPAPFFGMPDETWLRVKFKGGGFLKQMVRNMVGTLVEVGEGKRSPRDVIDILKARDRKKAGRTAPPQGLYLMSVNYGPPRPKGISKTRALPYRT